MRSIFVKSGLVAVASALASVVIGATVLGLQGLTLTGNALVMTLLCPLLVAWPASARTFVQKERLREAHTALTRAHSELAAAHVRLAERASRDHMTGMLNRESFFEALEMETANGVAGALLIIDADRFKAINDTYGHMDGDLALVEIARAIRRAAAPGGVIGRVGGEEFAVYLPRSDARTAAVAAEDIRREVASIEFRSSGGAAIALTVSVGVAVFSSGTPVDKIMRCADRRLYDAKEAGRNKVEIDATRAA